MKGIDRSAISPDEQTLLADEFRQGNVSPSRDITRLVDEAYEMLPPGPWRVRVRSDSAAYQQEVLDHWHNRGWEFAVSADMSRGLKREIERLPDDAWHLWKTEKDGVIKEWAEVPYVPTRHYEKRDSYPYRYVAVRLQSISAFWHPAFTALKLTSKRTSI